MFTGCQNPNGDPSVTPDAVQRMATNIKTLAVLTRTAATMLNNSNVIAEDDYESIYKVSTVVFTVAVAAEEITEDMNDVQSQEFLQRISDKIIDILVVLSDTNTVGEADIEKLERLTNELMTLIPLYAK